MLDIQPDQTVYTITRDVKNSSSKRVTFLVIDAHTETIVVINDVVSEILDSSIAEKELGLLLKENELTYLPVRLTHKLFGSRATRTMTFKEINEF